MEYFKEESVVDISIIGGSDGPTSIFLAGKVGFSWINTFGLVMVVLLLIPNIIYGFKFRNVKNQCRNSAMNMLEQVIFM